MTNKKIYIGLSIIAVAGVLLYYYNKNKEESKSNATGCPEGKIKCTLRGVPNSCCTAPK